jgi:hypothetical protein
MPLVLNNYHEEDASDDGTKPDGPTPQDVEAQPGANQEHQTPSGIQEGQTSTEQCQPMSPPKKVPTVLENHHEEQDASDDGTKPDGPTQQDEEAQPAADQEHQTRRKRKRKHCEDASQSDCKQGKPDNSLECLDNDPENATLASIPRTVSSDAAEQENTLEAHNYAF